MLYTFGMEIKFPHTIKASKPVDFNNREISVGQEVVILLGETLLSAEVLEVNLKTKKGKVKARKYGNPKKITTFSNISFTKEEEKFFEIFSEEELKKGVEIEVKQEYYSVKLQPKHGSAFATPHLHKIIVVAV